MDAPSVPSFRSQPPSLKAGLIRRPRLLAELSGRFDRRLTVVVAGAGYGKTTLLAQAVEENRMDPLGLDVWLLANERDRTPAHLLAGLSASLTGEAEALGTVDDLCDLVLVRAPEAVCIVLDDAHVLDGSESWELIRQLFADLPGNGHLVVGSRTMPALPVRRMQVNGEASVVEQESMAFTADELADLVDEVDFRTDGDGPLPSWPALAVLAGTAGHGASLGYLWEQILQGMPADRRTALALVSRLELIDDELVVAAAGPEWTASTIVAGLPLVDSLGTSHRLHDLWRAALADVVATREWQAALARAAEALLARGDLVRAVKSFRDAHQLDRMIEVIRQYAALPISAGLSRADAEVLYDLLPPAERAGPLGRCLRSILVWNSDDVHHALAQMLERASAVGDDEMRSLAWWRLVQLQGDTDPTQLVVTDELHELAAAGWPLARSAVALIRSHAAQEDRDVTTALSVLDELGGPDPHTRRVAMASRLVSLGHPERVPVTLEDVLAQGVADPIAAQAIWLRGEIDPDAAWAVAEPLPAAYRQRRLAAVEVPLLGIVSSVALAAGQFGAARELAASARSLAHLTVPRVALFAHVADALVALVDHGEDAFGDRLDAAGELVPLGGWPAWAYLGALASIRGLRPGTEWLDDLDVGPSLRTAIEAGRALTDLREGRGPDAASALPWSSVDLLRVHLPPPLLFELALAASEISPAAAALVERVPGASRWGRRLLAHPDPAVRTRTAALGGRVVLRPDHDLLVRTFGGLRLSRSDGVAVPGLESRGRLRQLLARLVVDRSVPRQELAEAMWPDLGAEQAGNNLRVTLSKLIDLLEPDRHGSSPWWIRADRDRLELATEGLRVDADQFDHALRSARSAEAQGAPSLADDQYERALDLYTGEYLAGIDEPVALPERLRFRSLAYGAACRRAELQLARGEPEAALAAATTAVRIDGYGERAYRIMISCHLALGATDAARATADLLRARLAEAGLEPDADTRRTLARLSG